MIFNYLELYQNDARKRSSSWAVNHCAEFEHGVLVELGEGGRGEQIRLRFTSTEALDMAAELIKHAKIVKKAQHGQKNTTTPVVG